MSDSSIDELLDEFDDVIVNTLASKEGKDVQDIQLDFKGQLRGLLMFSIAQDSIPYADDKVSILTDTL